ncbi:MAG: FAD-dependent oxidoreductase [Magnetococcales bacterium]|nr:FAD-dependent oxidoreductase [Magnetococcales bacterium]
MANLTRRTFIQAAGGVAAVGLIGAAPRDAAAAKAKVVVLGGGYGGAIAAKYIRMADPTIDVTMIEQDHNYYSCPLSNAVIGGFRDINVQKHSWAKAASKHGYKVIHDTATLIDPKKKVVKLAGGKSVPYDRIVVSPGVSYKYGDIEGHSKKISETVIPHAWKAGPQTVMLRKQLEAMKDGGTVIIVPPKNPFRCPPGPYERVSLIAYYLKHHKPKSKILILDPKNKFSKKGLFEGGWKKHYGYGTGKSLMEWLPADGGGKVVSIQPGSTMGATVVAGDMEDEHQGDVVNIIPNQEAGKIAIDSGLADKSGWCPVDKKTFESKLHKGVHVIGDASIATKMPKSGYAANSQGKVVANAVVAMLHGKDPGTASYVNTCYSFLTPTHGISVAAVYKLKGGVISKVKGSGGLSPGDASDEFKAQEAQYNESWYGSIMSDMFA